MSTFQKNLWKKQAAQMVKVSGAPPPTAPSNLGGQQILSKITLYPYLFIFLFFLFYTNTILLLLVDTF